MAFQFRPDREAHLRMLCEEMERSVDEVVNEAVLTFMEDYEDLRDAREALAEFETGKDSAIPLAEVLKEYGMDCGSDIESQEAAGQSRSADQATHRELPQREAAHAA